jgi:hypothetical protein
MLEPGYSYITLKFSKRLHRYMLCGGVAACLGMVLCVRTVCCAE